MIELLRLVIFHLGNIPIRSYFIYIVLHKVIVKLGGNRFDDLPIFSEGRAQARVLRQAHHLQLNQIFKLIQIGCGTAIDNPV